MESNNDIPANAHVLCPMCKTLIPVAMPDVAAKDKELSTLLFDLNQEKQERMKFEKEAAELREREKMSPLMKQYQEMEDRISKLTADYRRSTEAYTKEREQVRVLREALEKIVNSAPLQSLIGSGSDFDQGFDTSLDIIKEIAKAALSSSKSETNDK